jgi:hypothetical protein
MHHKTILHPTDRTITPLLSNITLLLLLTSSCHSQKLSVITDRDKVVKEVYNESIWIPNPNEESYNLKVSDTTAKVLNLTFEQGFDDSIKIFIDSKEVFSKKILTLKNIPVVDEEFKINYDSQNSLIEILLVNKNRKISFKPMPGYRICYLNRLLEIWSLEFSNYQRVYY